LLEIVYTFFGTGNGEFGTQRPPVGGIQEERSLKLI